MSRRRNRRPTRAAPPPPPRAPPTVHPSRPPPIPTPARLTLTVKSAHNLRDEAWLGKSDPYWQALASPPNLSSVPRNCAASACVPAQLASPFLQVGCITARPLYLPCQPAASALATHPPPTPRLHPLLLQRRSAGMRRDPDPPREAGGRAVQLERVCKRAVAGNGEGEGWAGHREKGANEGAPSMAQGAAPGTRPLVPALRAAVRLHFAPCLPARLQQFAFQDVSPDDVLEFRV